MAVVIDSHQHFWQLSKPFQYDWLRTPTMKPICQDFLPQHLQTRIQQVGVQKTVFVQTQHNTAENRWALQLADEHDFIAGVVGWVDLASDACEEQVLEFKQYPKFVGVRHVVQDEPDDDFIVRPSVLRGLKTLEKHGLPYDLLFYAKHLKHAPAVAQAVPELPLVIDHLSKPNIKAGLIDDWRTELQAAAQFPNVFCKLSGMITEADWQHWTPEDLRPYVETALEAFGPGRCMFGSDWPVCELAGTYTQVHQALLAALGPLSDTEMADIFGGTAQRFYNLPNMG